MEPLRRLLRLSLAPPHTVIEAADGGEALALLRQHQPNVAILDVAMPVLDGLALCRLIRDDPDLCDIGIIVASGSADGADALRAGADRFIGKPYRPRDVLAALDELVRTGYGRPQSSE
jgi:CheY-like chemotaxis protein